MLNLFQVYIWSDNSFSRIYCPQLDEFFCLETIVKSWIENKWKWVCKIKKFVSKGRHFCAVFCTWLKFFHIEWSYENAAYGKAKNERDSLTFIVWTRNNKNGKQKKNFFCLDSLYDQMVSSVKEMIWIMNLHFVLTLFVTKKKLFQLTTHNLSINFLKYIFIYFYFAIYKWRFFFSLI